MNLFDFKTEVIEGLLTRKGSVSVSPDFEIVSEGSFAFATIGQYNDGLTQDGTKEDRFSTHGVYVNHGHPGIIVHKEVNQVDLKVGREAINYRFLDTNDLVEEA